VALLGREDWSAATQAAGGQAGLSPPLISGGKRSCCVGTGSVSLLRAAAKVAFGLLLLQVRNSRTEGSGDLEKIKAANLIVHADNCAV